MFVGLQAFSGIVAFGRSFVTTPGSLVSVRGFFEKDWLQKGEGGRGSHRWMMGGQDGVPTFSGK
jgi:hypothetical protein